MPTFIRTFLADRVRMCKAREARSVQARAIVGHHLTKPTLCFPVSTRLRNLLRGPRHEVPPHQDRFWKWRSTDEQHPASVPTREGGFGASRSQVVQHSFLQRLRIERAVAVHHKDGVLVAMIQGNG